MDATCKIQDGIHMPRIIKKCVQDSGYISWKSRQKFQFYAKNTAKQSGSILSAAARRTPEPIIMGRNAAA